MSDFNLIYLLAGATFILVLAIGVWQIMRARQAKRDNEHSALTNKGRPSSGKA